MIPQCNSFQEMSSWRSSETLDRSQSVLLLEKLMKSIPPTTSVTGLSHSGPGYTFPNLIRAGYQTTKDKPSVPESARVVQTSHSKPAYCACLFLPTGTTMQVLDHFPFSSAWCLTLVLSLFPVGHAGSWESRKCKTPSSFSLLMCMWPRHISPR